MALQYIFLKPVKSSMSWIKYFLVAHYSFILLWTKKYKITHIFTYISIIKITNRQEHNCVEHNVINHFLTHWWWCFELIVECVNFCNIFSKVCIDFIWFHTLVQQSHANVSKWLSCLYLQSADLDTQVCLF